MAVPDYQSLMLPVLRAASKGLRSVPELAEEIADELGLSQADREAMLPSGKQRLLHNRIHWAKFYVGKAALIDSPKKGVFTASPAGSELLATNPPKIDNDTLLAQFAFRSFYQKESVDGMAPVRSRKA